MGGSSAVFRAFVEATSEVWGDDMRWKNKIASGFTNSGTVSGDKLHTLVDIALFAAQHGMIWVGLAEYAGWNSSTGSPEDVNRLGSWLGAMSQSNIDQGPEVTPGDSDLRTAEFLGRRVAETTQVFLRGRAAEEAAVRGPRGRPRGAHPVPRLRWSVPTGVIGGDGGDGSRTSSADARKGGTFAPLRREFPWTTSASSPACPWSISPLRRRARSGAADSGGPWEPTATRPPSPPRPPPPGGCGSAAGR
jgi:hypothetical protein